MDRVTREPEKIPAKTMATVEAFAFMPFRVRALSRPNDRVIGLRFEYDARITAPLKAAIRRHEAKAIDKAAYRHNGGGWLKRERCWFVEPAIWPEVRLELEQAGCLVVEVRP